MSEQFEENPTVQARKWSNRWQGIYLKLKELNVVTHDHAYLELHKSGKEGKLDLGTRKIICTNKELALRSSLGEESIIQSSINESLLTAEQVSTFTTPSKWQTYLKKATTKKIGLGEQICPLCSQTTNILWIGCDYQNQNDVKCSYWVHAMCMGFPDAEDETFKNITFRCPTHNRENKAAVNSTIKETSLWKE